VERIPQESANLCRKIGIIISRKVSYARRAIWWESEKYYRISLEVLKGKDIGARRRIFLKGSRI